VIDEIEEFQFDVNTYFVDLMYQEVVESNLYPKIKSLKYYLNLLNAKTLIKEIDRFDFEKGNAIKILEEVRNGFILDESRRLVSKIDEEEMERCFNSASPFDLYDFHEKIKSIAGPLFNNGHYRQAILDVYIALVEEVKNKSKLNNLDNTALMQKVFSKNNPILKVSDNEDEQLGFMWLFSGSVMAIRNPKAHSLIEQNNPERTLEWLAFASVLFKILDESEKV
jgi:uncharacterized protein (TIGR02391 family)